MANLGLFYCVTCELPYSHMHEVETNFLFRISNRNPELHLSLSYDENHLLYFHVLSMWTSLDCLLVQEDGQTSSAVST